MTKSQRGFHRGPAITINRPGAITFNRIAAMELAAFGVKRVRVDLDPSTCTLTISRTGPGDADGKPLQFGEVNRYPAYVYLRRALASSGYLFKRSEVLHPRWDPNLLGYVAQVPKDEIGGYLADLKRRLAEHLKSKSASDA